MRLALLAGLAVCLPLAGQESDQQLKEAGVCARCHVISVVEWGVSRHWKVGANCVACHGASQGHVIDERNNVKPERVPHGEAIQGLCANCHQNGCPKSKQKTACQTCHHVHALLHPDAPPGPAAPPVAAKTVVRRDVAAGLAPEVRVPGVNLTMILIRGGDVDLGSEQIPNAKPVHTVQVLPFYLAAHEVTEAQWQAVMGGGRGSTLPATGVSWLDAMSFIGRLNETIPGGGFRLPTEAEWEFAARSGGFTGDAVDRGAVLPAGQGRANSLGLSDLRGNVWEWCSSLDRPYPYDALDGRERADASGLRILRGGGYADPASWVAPATRHAERPDRRLPWYGLRVARSLAGQ